MQTCGVGSTDDVTMSDADLEDFFCDQVNTVRHFVEEHPSHTLIEVQLEDEETPSIMADYFGIRASCWGHENVNSNAK